MPQSFQTPSLQQALEEARQFRDVKRGEGFLSQVGVGADKAFSFLGNLPNQLAFGEDFAKIREQSSQLPGFIQEETARKPTTFGEKLGQGLGVAAVEAPIDLALIAGTGGLGASAVLPRAAQLFAGGALSGGIGGAAVPEAFGLDPDARLEGALLGGATAGLLSAALPIGLRPLSKYIPGIRNAVPDMSLREAFQESIATASMGGEVGKAATTLIPRDDVIDQVFFGGQQGIRLRSLGEAVDSQIRGVNGTQPFRQLKGSPQFTADTVVQKGLREAGLSSTQTKFLMESLTDLERTALAPSLDPLARSLEPGALPLSDALIKAVERVAGPEAQALTKKLLAEGFAGSETLKGQLIASLKRAGVEVPDEAAINKATQAVDDLIEQEPALGLLLPKLFNQVIPPGQQTRMAEHLSESIGKVKGSKIGSAIGRGTDALFPLLRNIRIAGMLTSLTAPMKNIVFNGVNVGANIAGRGVASFGSKRVDGGEALAMVKGLWRGMTDDLSTYGAQSRFLRESEANNNIPILSLGSDFLKYTDKKFFNRTFAAEMHAEAFKEARKAGLSQSEALASTERFLALKGRELFESATYKKALAKSEKLAAEKGIEDATVISTEAARIVRNSGQEPVSIREARLMAERAIFVAREGRLFDDALALMDKFDVATNGAVSVVTPFRRTPANELREFVRASGGDLVGLAHRRITQDVAAGVEEEIARTRAARDIGKAVVGGTVTSGIMFALSHGLLEVVDDEGKSRAQLDTERAQGVPRRSVIMGDWVVPLHTMGPIGRIVAQADILLKQGQGLAAGEINADQGMSNLFRQVTNSLAEDFLTSDWIGFAESLESEQGMQRYAQRLGASFVPGAIRQAFGQGTEFRRPDETPRGFLSSVKAGFETEASGIVNQLNQQKTFDRGEPIVGLFGVTSKKGSGLSRVFGESKKDDLVAQTAAELQRMGLYKEAPDTKIPNVEWIGLEKTEFAKAKGQLQLQFVRQVMDHPNYQQLPDVTKAKLVNSQMRKASRLANGRARVGKARGFPITGRFILSGRIGP